MKTTRWSAALLAIVVVSAFAGSGRAQPDTDDQRARNHFLAGTSYYNESRYEQALAEFLEAYRLSHRAELLVNASRAAERNLDFQQAIELVDRFLAEAPADHAQRASETTRREQLVILAERAGPRVTTPPPVDDPPVVEPPVADDEGGGLGTLGYVGIGTLGGGVALGAISLATGLVANNRFGDLENDCPGGICDPNRQSDIDSGRRLARVSTATTFIGIGAIAAGIVLLIVDDGPPEDDAPTARPRVTQGPGTAGIGLGWSF